MEIYDEHFLVYPHSYQMSTPNTMQIGSLSVSLCHVQLNLVLASRLNKVQATYDGMVFCRNIYNLQRQTFFELSGQSYNIINSKEKINTQMYSAHT